MELELEMTAVDAAVDEIAGRLTFRLPQLGKSLPPAPAAVGSVA